MTAGIDTWRTAACARLGIPSVRTTDGPNGARGDTRDHTSVTPSVCIPSATALGATWDPDVVRQASAIVARQAREKSARILLAPTVNLHRHPLWVGTSSVRGGSGADRQAGDRLHPRRSEQRRGCHNQALRRERGRVRTQHVSSEIDERALRELYLLPFEYGVHVGGVLAVMTAYNRVNGQFRHR